MAVRRPPVEADPIAESAFEAIFSHLFGLFRPDRFPAGVLTRQQHFQENRL
jgi:hypothetical protein